MIRKSYPSDVSDEEWEFVVPYLTLMTPDAPQRHHDLREVFNALRWLVRTGSPWRYLPNDLPRWDVVYRQTQRWINAQVFEAIAHDLRVLLREAAGKNAAPSAVIFDSRTLQSTPESGHRAGMNVHKARKGTKVHAAVDTLGHLLALCVTPANQGDRSQVEALCDEALCDEALCDAVQEVTGHEVDVAFVDGGYSGAEVEKEAAKHKIKLRVVKVQKAKKGFVLLPKRWVVERSFAWVSRFRRLAKDYERLPETVKSLHILAFVTLMLTNCFQ
ncbi:transposase, IS4 family [Abditibacterium utsteinense]|uniref:Transposase, IS4 family n=1 Tax=Abditibacterium utsteinense TaxID=1960156 RepID=A0A2S8SRU7_9BACT|nr:IS5 family transposase [Abditibacterium utsteinense]PQV63542.1 transposase, IS4 family [Abditibacterium utsteinense]